jgi:hypothetical protein
LSRPDSKSAGYFNYFTFGLSGYADRLLVRIRQEVYQHFLEAFHPTPHDTVLDIGVSPNEHTSSNFLERSYPWTQAIVALGVAPYPELRDAFPGIKLLCGEGRALPLRSRSVDLVYSHAVIEHVGSRARQAVFLAEALRVCRKGVLITTPNRWHPVETHTGLPFLHYLPPRVWYSICNAVGRDMYAREDALNLLSARDLTALLDGLDRGEWEYELRGVRWLGVVSNYVLVVRRLSGGAVKEHA